MQEIIQDPTGFEVILTDKCWTDYILRRHPELGPFQKLVVETVKKSDGIYKEKETHPTEFTQESIPKFLAWGTGLTC